MSVMLIVLLYTTDATFLAPGQLTVRDLDEDEYRVLMDKYQMEYDIWVLSEDSEHYKWNLRSTKYIFWVSMIISMSGVAFAFWQFAQANEFDRLQSERDEVEFKSHMASLSFKTRSIASFILVVSIIYLMIYVQFLYPVQHFPTSDQASAGVADANADAARAQAEFPHTGELSGGPEAEPEMLPPNVPDNLQQDTR